MLNLSCSSNYSNELFDFEIGDKSRLQRHQKSRLPRHISSLESRSHSHKTCSNLFEAVQACSLERTNSDEAIGAVKILQYQLQDSASQRKHLENLHANLLHRLQVAKSTKNSQLIALLESEFRQLQVSN